MSLVEDAGARRACTFMARGATWRRVASLCAALTLCGVVARASGGFHISEYPPAANAVGASAAASNANPTRFTISPCRPFVAATLCNQLPVRRTRRLSRSNTDGRVSRRWHSRHSRSLGSLCQQRGHFRRRRTSAPQPYRKGFLSIPDVASPAFRVTVPCVVQIAYIRQKTLRRALENSCPACNKVNPVDASYCAHCGKRIPEKSSLPVGLTIMTDRFSSPSL